MSVILKSYYSKIQPSSQYTKITNLPKIQINQFLLFNKKILKLLKILQNQTTLFNYKKKSKIFHF